MFTYIFCKHLLVILLIYCIHVGWFISVNIDLFGLFYFFHISFKLLLEFILMVMESIWRKRFCMSFPNRINSSCWSCDLAVFNTYVSFCLPVHLFFKCISAHLIRLCRLPSFLHIFSCMTSRLTVTCSSSNEWNSLASWWYWTEMQVVDKRGLNQRNCWENLSNGLCLSTLPQKVVYVVNFVTETADGSGFNFHIKKFLFAGYYSV